MHNFGDYPGVESTGLIPWVGGPLDAFFGFYLREAFQGQTNTEKRLYSKSSWALICYRN